MHLITLFLITASAVLASKATKHTINKVISAEFGSFDPDSEHPAWWYSGYFENGAPVPDSVFAAYEQSRNGLVGSVTDEGFDHGLSPEAVHAMRKPLNEDLIKTDDYNWSDEISFDDNEDDDYFSSRNVAEKESKTEASSVRLSDWADRSSDDSWSDEFEPTREDSFYTGEGAQDEDEEPFSPSNPEMNALEKHRKDNKK